MLRLNFLQKCKNDAFLEAVPSVPTSYYLVLLMTALPDHFPPHCSAYLYPMDGLVVYVSRIVGTVKVQEIDTHTDHHRKD